MLMAACRPGGICGCVRGSLAARADIAQELHPAPGVRSVHGKRLFLENPHTAGMHLYNVRVLFS